MAKNNFDAWFIKKERFILAAFLIIVFVYTFSSMFFIQNQWAQDSHWYMSLAKNIVSGNGYTIDGKIPFAQYPPVFPLLISFFYILIPNIHLAGMILIGFLTILTVFMMYKFGKMHSSFVALFSSLILLVHHSFIFNSTSIMTEIPFMLFSLLGLYFFIKGFEGTKYFIFAFPVIALTCLTRYSGFLLIFPMIYYSLVNYKKFKRLLLNDKVLIGGFIGSLMFFFWGLRNFLVFGNPFFTQYTDIAHKITLNNFFEFSILFFKSGFIFPFLVLIGIFFTIKSRDKKIITLLVYFLFYFILHASWWGGTVFRFYVGVLPILCIFSAIALYNLSKKLKTKKRRILFLSSIIIIILFSQLFIFFTGDFNNETSLEKINRYSSIQDVSEWALSNLPANSNYLVSDIAVYSMYLPRENIFYYNEGINLLIQREISLDNTYIFAETHHNWMTAPFLEGEKGIVNLPLDSGEELIIQTKLLKKEEYKGHYAILLRIVNIGVVN